MFFNRSKKAVDITSDSLRFVEVEEGSDKPRLLFSGQEELPGGLVSPSLAKPNLSDREAFKERVFALVPDNKRKGDMALSLPDSLVKVTALSFEDLPDKKEEATDLILWRLKKTVPLATDLLVVDYAVHSSEEGAVQVLAVAASKTVIREYEDVFRELGFRPRIVDMAAFGAFYLFRKALKESALFINFKDNVMSFAFQAEGKVEFFRSKEMECTPAAVEKEFTSTCRYYQTHFRKESIEKVSLHLAGAHTAPILEALKNSFKGEVSTLNLSDAVRHPENLIPDENYSSAIGLALRL